MVHEVVVTMIEFATEREMNSKYLELAVECYTELLKLLHFKFLPGVLLGRAGCLQNLV